MARIAVVEKEKCNPLKCGNYLCVRYCPVNRDGKECMLPGDDSKVMINEELCIGCNICVHKCPFDALHIINLPTALTSDPIHRYGVNAFSLYNLPIPIFGKVVGIIGRNGIGKSTAIKILAGVMKPNLGKIGSEATYEQMIDRFKGTEAQGFFEKMHKGEIKVSYKPQQVDQIPTHYSGTVRSLLEKSDEKKQMKSICSELGITKILDHDIKQISGGELQRVAIAACVLKKANVYFFDEPTSYLDIKQRLIVSHFIRKLADEKTAVLVIEHDLIILDAVSELVHIMYGKENAYGIVSHVKSAKAGINTYLDGYIRDENMRFRDHAIHFEKRPPSESDKDLSLTSWSAIRHTLGTFTIGSGSGEIFRHDVIGVLGENGIGKTTFIKLLAGVIDNPAALKSIKIAYKPQYLEPNDSYVMDILRDIGSYESILRPLHLAMLYDLKLSELSGGQLQRVAIARTLLQNADLYLLDEPSAYLDVEQRLMLSKVIRDMMNAKGKAALIVDHDLLFIDYLSKRLLVFTGEPAVKGVAKGPYSMQEGMNLFLSDIHLTFRRDEENNRPRVNKPESKMDQKQRSEGKLYYD
ncbi:MAG: ribosome biogenesis/translation initiation ATPase RLI [Nanoarchaeota archaeon]